MKHGMNKVLRMLCFLKVELNTGRPVLCTLPLLYLKHLISKYRGGFFCFRPDTAIPQKQYFSN